jgi:hypothetical protein
MRGFNFFKLNSQCVFMNQRSFETSVWLSLVFLISGALAVADDSRFEKEIVPFFGRYCLDCHDDSATEGNLSLEQIDPKIGGGPDFETWRIILERVKFQDMPPEDADQPAALERKAFVNWIRGKLLETQQPGFPIEDKLKLPAFGNYVDHAALFSESAGQPVIPGPPRIWRLRQKIYGNLPVGDQRLRRSHSLTDPLVLRDGSGFRDYAARYFIDEPTTEMLLSNAEKIVPVRSRFALNLLTEKPEGPTDETLRFVIQKTFLELLRRKPEDDEFERFVRFYHAVAEENGRQVAAERLLMAVYMRPETLFREELGEGTADKYGRVRLSQMEIALAISYALGDSPDAQLLEAAGNGELATKADVAAHVKRRLENPPARFGNPRVIEFFREFFHYPYALEVFKDKPDRGYHLPHLLVQDLERLILSIVDKDRQVLRELLTTDQYFVDIDYDKDKTAFQPSMRQPGNGNNPVKSDPEYATLYGLPRDWVWTEEQPVVMPKGQRVGVLTHPAWLVAWSGNFDNHPVQRGKWIRTHLLGGTIPDVPICVDAKVPENEHQQFRERLVAATELDTCWRCHKKMDPLGLPFEQYTHYGRRQRTEMGRPVDTTGAVSFVGGDLEWGEVTSPIDLMQRLGNSTYVEQVFVRHAFRFFMGRNETLGDAATLQKAHAAYRDNNGSFQALVVSLLSSDSFLLRFVGEGGTGKTFIRSPMPATRNPGVAQISKPTRKKETVPYRVLTVQESHAAIIAAIRERIRKPEGELTQADYDRVTFLNLQGKGFVDISPLRKLTKLKNLRLDYNDLTDISSLANAVEIDKLELTGNRLKSLAPVAKMKKLRWLTFARNEVADLSPLAGLTGLEFISCYVNPITDVSALHGLTELKKVKLQGNPVPETKLAKARLALPKCDVKWQATNHVWDQHSPFDRGSIGRHLKLPETEIPRGHDPWPAEFLTRYSNQ